jgi:hypothetical protein
MLPNAITLSRLAVHSAGRLLFLVRGIDVRIKSGLRAGPAGPLGLSPLTRGFKRVEEETSDMTLREKVPV